ncbi:MAG: YbaB/EbfC family nucleoid-associated protein [Spirochaetales bacterium]|nr:YbaB/EbfC family nucleoid-associated protein [Candidatus Physcosoma equi]
MKQMGNWEAQMKTIKEQLASLTATGSAGAGMVEVTVNGEHKVQKVSINDVMLSPENKGMIETLVASAFNDATDKIIQVTEDFARHQAMKGFGNELN